MSFTLTRIVIVVSSERTTFGSKVTVSTISRSVAGTFVTGIDRSPFGRTIVPPGPDALIVPVALEATVFEPAELDPVTRTRMRRPTSPDPSA